MARFPTNPYFETRLVGERDSRLSAQSYRVLCCILTHRAGRYLDEDFALPWSLISDWLGLQEDQCYRMIRQLVAAGYLKLGELKRCPAERHYFLLPSSRKNAGTSSGENAGTSSGENAGTGSRKKAAPHISIPCGKEVSRRIEGSRNNGALRAGEEEGEELSSGSAPIAPDGTELHRIDWDRLKKDAGV